MLSAAATGSPVRASSIVSYARAENVVNPPQNPIRIALRQIGFAAARSRSNVAAKPTMNDPTTLTASVPYGNVVPVIRWTNPCTQYRASVPTIPNPPMSKILSMGRLYTAASLAVAGLLLVSCSKEAVLRNVEPAFTAETLRQGRLAILGVVQKDEIAQVRRPLTESLEHVLSVSRKDIQTVPWDAVLAALDDSTERFLLLSYQYQGAAEERWLRRASNEIKAAADGGTLGRLDSLNTGSLPNPRYGILVRVESQRVRYATREIIASPAPGQPATEVPVRIGGRDVVITAIVYDLNTLENVFSGQFQGFGENAAMPDTLPPPEDRPPIQGWSTPEDRAVEAQPTAPGTPPPGQAYPEPPPLAKAAEAAFTHLAGSLPGAEPSPASKAPR